MSGRSVILNNLFQGKPPTGSLPVHKENSFVIKADGEKGHINIFMTYM